MRGMCSCVRTSKPWRRDLRPRRQARVQHCRSAGRPKSRARSESTRRASLAPASVWRPCLGLLVTVVSRFEVEVEVGVARRGGWWWSGVRRDLDGCEEDAKKALDAVRVQDGKTTWEELRFCIMCGSAPSSL